MHYGEIFLWVDNWCSVYGRGRKLEKAVEMFNKARCSGVGVSLDEKTYTNLISYYGKAGNNFLPF